MPAPCDMGNNYKRAVHLPSRKGWDGRKLIKKQTLSAGCQEKFQLKVQKDENTTIQETTCFCRQRSYQIQISKILFGLFMTFRKIFMCYLEKYTRRNLSCQVCNFYYALNKVQHVICHGLISMSNLSLHIVKIEIFYQQQLSLKYSYTNHPQRCLKVMQGN